MKENIIKYARDETIAAVITPPGEGGIGAIRVAGPAAGNVIEKIFRPSGESPAPGIMFHMYFGHIVDNKGDIIDEVTVVQMPEGHSYTGQRQAEIFCHGGQYVLRRILKEIFQIGIRPAEPGEFTRRAFLAGRIDLARAEAVADIIASKTEYAYNAARNNLLGSFSNYIDSVRNEALDRLSEIEASIDYPEEDLELAQKNKLTNSLKNIVAELKELVESYHSGKIIKEGFKIVIAGRPNAGKSSLFNLLLNQNRAIVAPMPGTTRDYLTEWVDIDGLAVSITDTAGLRGSGGAIERAGQTSAKGIIADSDLILWMADITTSNWRKELLEDIRTLGKLNYLLIFNKIDLLDKNKMMKSKEGLDISSRIMLSCITKLGFKELRKKLRDNIMGKMPDLTDRLVVTSERHKQKLEKALRDFKRAEKSMAKGISSELIAFEFRQAINEIDEITGVIYNEEILDRIFKRFCIGK